MNMATYLTRRFIISSLTQLFGWVVFLVAGVATADLLVANGSDIIKVNDDGTGSTTYISGATYGLFYDSVAEYVYFTGPSNSIRRANRDGSNVTTIVANAGDVVVDVVVDRTNNKIIWTALNDAKIRRANLDGSSVEDLITGVSFPHGLAIDATGGYIYWAGYSEIYRAQLDGTSATPVLVDSDVGQLAFLLIESGKVYWSNYDANKIKRANLDGSSIEVLASGSNATGPEGISRNSATGELFYLGHPSTGGALRRMGLDGSGNAAINATTRGYDIITGFTSTAPTPTPTTTPTATVTATPTITPTAGPSATPTPFPTAQNGNTSMIIAVGPRSNNDVTGKIIRTDATGRQTVLLSGGADSRASGPTALAYSESRQRLYWANGSSTVYSMTPAGTSITTEFSISEEIRGMVVDDTNGLLYFSACGSTCSINVVGLDSPSTTTVLASNYGRLAGGLILRGDNIIWGDVPRLSYVTRLGAGSYSAAAEYVNFGYNFYSIAAWGQKIIVGNNGIYALSGEIGSKQYSTVASYQYASVYSYVITALATKQLDTSRFDVPLVFYAGGPGGVVKIVAPNDTSAFALFLGVDLEVTALLEINVRGQAPATPTATPTALPNNQRRITGKIVYPAIEEASLSQSGASTVLSPPIGPKAISLADIPVYLSPLSADGVSPAEGTDLITQRTLTDQNGEYVFVGMPEGQYKITFDRADLGFFVDSLIVSTDTYPPEVVVSAATVDAKGCKFKNAVKKVTNFETKAEALVSFVLSTAASVKTLGQSELTSEAAGALTARLDAAAEKARVAYGKLVTASQALPEVALSCTKKAGCKEKDLTAKARILSKQLTAISNSGLAVVKAAEGSLAKSNKKRFATERKNLLRLKNAALKISGLPTKTFTCKPAAIKKS